jgi:hypothetical protein
MTPTRLTFRDLAEDELGQPVSAGARLAHVQSARGLSIDLSRVPEEKRPELVATIRELVAKAASLDGKPVRS